MRTRGGRLNHLGMEGAPSKLRINSFLKIYYLFDIRVKKSHNRPGDL